MILRLVNRFFQIVNQKGWRTAISTTLTFLKMFPIKFSNKIRVKYKRFNVMNENKYSIHMNYKKMNKSDIARLCDKYGTDKGELTSDSNPYSWPSHNYSDYYELIFRPRKNSVESLLECGIGTNYTDVPSSMSEDANPGASLRVWRDYFPNAEIIGIDIDDRIMFSEERIDTYCADQTSEDSIQEFLNNTNINNFDVIIDDGLHEYGASVTFFENTISQLNDDGVYIIEDVPHGDIEKYQNYFIEDLESYHAKFIELENPRRSDPQVDRLIMITPIE